MGSSTNFVRCVAEMLLLSLIEEEDMYAYQLSQMIETRSEGLVIIHESTIYSVLYRMEKHGFISSRPVEYSKRFRIYYHLEPAGKRYLEESLQEYMKLSLGLSLILERRQEQMGNDKCEDRRYTVSGGKCYLRLL